jgi:predicted nucleotidyltransferase
MINQMDFGLSEKTVKQIRFVFSRYPQIEQVMIYGSRAKASYRHGSDIDLTITRALPEFINIAGIETELDDLLLPYGIDLSLFRDIKNMELINHIERVGVVFYNKSSNDVDTSIKQLDAGVSESMGNVVGDIK